MIAETVAEIVRSGMDKKAASVFIRQRADQGLPQDDRARFVEVAETEIMNLHEGNIARYRLRPSEYQSWIDKWSCPTASSPCQSSSINPMEM